MWTFNNVRVFAGDNFSPAADASYRNLVWENIPIPDFMFRLNFPVHVYSPAMVRIYASPPCPTDILTGDSAQLQ